MKITKDQLREAIADAKVEHDNRVKEVRYQMEQLDSYYASVVAGLNHLLANAEEPEQK